MYGTSASGGTGAFTLKLLNGFALERDEVPVELSLTGQRLLGLVALAGPLTRSAAAGTLWPEVTEQRAHSSLRTTIWRLHRRGCLPVEARGDRLELAMDVSVDARTFADCAVWLLHAQPLADDYAGDHADEDAARAAVILTAGELLPGWCDDWVTFERERLRQLRLHALEALSYRFLARERHADALGAAMEAIRIDPLRESPHRAAIAVHVAEGNLIEAMRHRARFRQLLLDELGIEPSPLLGDLPTAKVTRDQARSLPRVTGRRSPVGRSGTVPVALPRPLPARP